MDKNKFKINKSKLKNSNHTLKKIRQVTHDKINHSPQSKSINWEQQKQIQTRSHGGNQCSKLQQVQVNKIFQKIKTFKN